MMLFLLHDVVELVDDVCLRSVHLDDDGDEFLSVLPILDVIALIFNVVADIVDVIVVTVDGPLLSLSLSLSFSDVVLDIATY